MTKFAVFQEIHGLGEKYTQVFYRQTVIQAKCYKGKLLYRQTVIQANVIQANCYTGEWVLGKWVLGRWVLGNEY